MATEEIRDLGPSPGGHTVEYRVSDSGVENLWIYGGIATFWEQKFPEGALNKDTYTSVSVTGRCAKVSDVRIVNPMNVPIEFRIDGERLVVYTTMEQMNSIVEAYAEAVLNHEQESGERAA